MSEYNSTFVQCPFYIENYSRKQASENRIRCEGIEENNKINLVFLTQKDKQRYMVKYCYGVLSCKQCRIHKMLSEMYGGDDE